MGNNPKSAYTDHILFTGSCVLAVPISIVIPEKPPGKGLVFSFLVIGKPVDGVSHQ